MSRPINPATPVIFAPRNKGILDSLAEVVMQHRQSHGHTAELRILVPDLSAAAAIRQALLRHSAAAEALLCPDILTLQQYAENDAPQSGRILNNHARELMLVEVLRDSSALKGKGNAWQLADELLKLFDELELSKLTLDTLGEQFLDPGRSVFSDDADLIRLLWKARSEQMEAELCSDHVQLYSRGLIQLAQEKPHQPSVVLAGFDWLSQRELEWLRTALKRSRAQILLDADSPLGTDLSNFTRADDNLSPHQAPLQTVLDLAYGNDGSIIERARQIALVESPFDDRLAVFSAQNPEHEARGIELQIRQWLAKGLRQIGIVTENRQLARRISALINHRGLQTQDQAGWPLSTTVAAGSLERWLETIETDFHYLSLLDVLKSHFLFHPSVRQQDLFHFERDVIEHEKEARGLQNYRSAIHSRAQRLQSLNHEYPKNLLALIDHIEAAAKPLLALLDSRSAQRPGIFLSALKSSLQQLGLAQGYATDPAGQRIIQELEDMKQSEAGREIHFTWGEFRAWLNRALETHNFRPARQPSPVSILSLRQCALAQFDALVIAGMDNQQIPHPPARLVFFNDQVRAQLGLLSAEVESSRQFCQFRRLLQSTDNVLVSYSIEADGAPRLPSPWLARLETFHQLAFAKPLPEYQFSAPDFLELANSAIAPELLPSAVQAAAPRVWPSLRKETLSARAHQQLIRCPYAYFSADTLALRAAEDISEQLGRRDFGSSVHRCLQAFHSDVADLPGPFVEVVDTQSRDDAETLLRKIGIAEFRPDSRDDLRHQQWHRDWKKMIPLILDWEQERQQQWRVSKIELAGEREIAENLILFGTIDRVETRSADEAIVDYKSGFAASSEDILNGEDVQLLSYALLRPASCSIAYLPLNSKEKLKPVTVEGDELEQAKEQALERLRRLAKDITLELPLPANGASLACMYCPFGGVCRREMLDS